MSKVIGLTKMALKTMGCNPKVASVNDAPTDMCLIFGRVVKLLHAPDPKGDTYTALIGKFEGKNLQTGQSYEAAKLFLPAGIQELLEAPFLDETPPPAIEFGFKIIAIPANNPIGYSYSFESIKDPQAHDELGALRNSVLALESSKVETPKLESKKK